MRAPLSWIRDFTPIDAAPDVVGDALDNLGLEVEGIDAPGAEIGGVVAARIVEVLPHPNADKLQLADVETGDGVVRVVCGAPNIHAGMVVPLATVGGRLPGIDIAKRKIRGEVSQGMLCSARELGLGDDHTGILELDAAIELGTDVREVLSLDDVVFDLKVTPNRPDAMGIVGIARELAAHFKLPLNVPIDESARAVDLLGDATAVVEAPDRCPRLVVRVATVTMGESPDWMQRRLRLAGMRPISNVVDVTNYVMLERCRPLHAFDLGRLAGRGILVRLAKPNERMTTLDDVERTLHNDDLLICDAESAPQAIAGIMGGRNSEVDGSTREILLESAYFEPAGIAATAKRLGLRSEASARFERGIDPNGAATGAARAVELLEQVAGAQALDGMIDRYPDPIPRPRISVRTARINAILGTTLDAATAKDLLRPLDIEIADEAGDVFVAVTPTSRPDLTREIDIVEEVGRRFGLNNIARTLPRSPEVGGLTREQRDRRLVADVLVGAGLCEAFTLPAVAPADLEATGLPLAAIVEIENPLRAEESVLRTALLPGLLAALGTNVARGNTDASLFEMGTVFSAPAPGTLLPVERDFVGAAATGMHRERPFGDDRALEPADAVAWLEAIADALRLADVRLLAGGGPGFDARRSARVLVDGTEAGRLGAVAVSVAAHHGVDGAIALEVDLGLLIGARRRSILAAPVSRFPSSNVDLAFVVAETVPAGDVLRTLEEAGGDLLESVSVFDTFRSDAIGPERVSLAFALRFRAPDRTLTDAEVAPLRQRAIDAVVAAHGAELRG